MGKERGKYGGEEGPYGGAAHAARGARTSGGPQGHGADNRPHLSWLRQAQLALGSLLTLQAESLGPALPEELMGRAAALFEAARGSPWEVELRRRGGLLAKETGPASRYEELRRQFVEHCVERGGPQWVGPLDDFGRLQDECDSFIDWPLRSGQVQGQAAGLLQDLSFHDGPVAPPGQAPDWPAPSLPGAPEGGADTQCPPSPAVTAEAFLAELDRVARLARREHAWGCYLLGFFHEVERPDGGGRGERLRLLSRLQPAAPAVKAVQQAASHVLEAHMPVRHGPDFRTVLWFGKEHAFTPTQAACVRALWGAWENGTPDVGQAALLELVESDCPRLQDVFKGHKTWKELIGSARRGCFRLLVAP